MITYLSRCFSICLVILTSLLSDANATSCSQGSGYSVSEPPPNNYTVHISIRSPSRTCGGLERMLRQNIATGSVVELANYCVDGQYVDECVPVGDYRYGLATPLDCSEAGTCGGMPYYATINVPVAAPSDCTRSAGNIAPTDYTDAAPWSGKPNTYVDCPMSDSGCSCSVPSRSAGGFFGVLIAFTIAIWRRYRGVA
jgi:MYXO-CTERM domain-containing protein